MEKKVFKLTYDLQKELIKIAMLKEQDKIKKLEKRPWSPITLFQDHMIEN